eukprot:189178-Pyramimonas_sp.AAC.1
MIVCGPVAQQPADVWAYGRVLPLGRGITRNLAHSTTEAQDCRRDSHASLYQNLQFKQIATAPKLRINKSQQPNNDV